MIIRDKVRTQPSDGTHAGVSADVEELGTMVNAFGNTQEKIRIHYLLDERDPGTGEPIRISELLTASRHPKGKLYQRVIALLGSMPAELDTEELVGKACSITTEQAPNRNGSVFANVLSLKPAKPGQPVVRIPVGFQRVRDRPKQPPSTAPPKQRR